MIRSWKVYGAEGHRQKESFNKSCKYDWTEGENLRRITVENSDITGTNEYTIIRIERNTFEECEDELNGQLLDGIFENSRTGKIEEITDIKAILEEINKTSTDRLVEFWSDFWMNDHEKSYWRMWELDEVLRYSEVDIDDILDENFDKSQPYFTEINGKLVSVNNLLPADIDELVWYIQNGYASIISIESN